MEPARKRKRKDKIPREVKILDLPNEVLETIFLMLPLKDILRNVAMVCQRFLEITRNQNFVQNVKIDLSPDEYDITKVEKSCWQRVKKVLQIYPKCEIELYHITKGLNGIAINDIVGYSWMSCFSSFASSITKMTLDVTHENLDNFSDFIVLENLECLDLTISAPEDPLEEGEELVGPGDLGAEFWNNFPKLKFLTFKSWDTQLCHTKDFDIFMDLISSECQNLEHFVYKGYKSFDIGPSFPSQNEEKFPKLKYIRAEFDVCHYHLIGNESWDLAANLESFKNYLSTKCPTLEKPIQQLELKKPPGLTYYGTILTVFESK